MKWITGIFGGWCLGLAGLLITVIVSPFPRAPFGLHQLLLFPAACAGSSCVTYRAWWTAVTNRPGRIQPDAVLTGLLEERALRQVAFREGVRVSEQELAQALEAVYASLDGVPGGEETLQALYGSDPDGALRRGLRVLLLRQKLIAHSIRSPWDGQNAPRVTAWNIHIRWDPVRHAIVARTGHAALAREQGVREKLNQGECGPSCSPRPFSLLSP